MSKITVELVESLNVSYIVPPEYRGQTVEVAYAADWDERLVVRRTHDRSTGRVSYEWAPAESIYGDWEPWDRKPSLKGKRVWRKVAQ